MIIKEFMDMHNHTTHSDGFLTPEQLSEHAVSKGIRHLGISDHAMLNQERGLDRGRFEEYFHEISKLKTDYENQMTIYRGLEIHVSDWPFLNRDMGLLSELDYLFIEGIDRQEISEIEEIFAGFARTGCGLGLAHTDLVRLCARLGTSELTGVMSRYQVFWELNTRDRHLYFDQLLKELYSEKIKSFLDHIKGNHIAVTAGSDLHARSDFSMKRLKIANNIAWNVNKNYD